LHGAHAAKPHRATVQRCKRHESLSASQIKAQTA